MKPCIAFIPIIGWPSRLIYKMAKTDGLISFGILGILIYKIYDGFLRLKLQQCVGFPLLRRVKRIARNKKKDDQKKSPRELINYFRFKSIV